ncbi:hypothetical protein FI667_g2188, partial [Globisporangium splendens]
MANEAVQSTSRECAFPDDDDDAPTEPCGACGVTVHPVCSKRTFKGALRQSFCSERCASAEEKEPRALKRFHFTPEADLVVLREALKIEPYRAPHGQKLKLVETFAENVGAALEASLSTRSINERFKHLVDKYERNTIKITKYTEEQYEEMEQLLEEICSRIAAHNNAKRGKRPETRGMIFREDAVPRRGRKRSIDESDAASCASSSVEVLTQPPPPRRIHDDETTAQSSRRSINGDDDALELSLNQKVAHLIAENAKKDLVLDFLKKQWEAEIALRREDNELRREEMQLRREELALQRIQLELEIKRREQDRAMLLEAIRKK